jgi:hypothetical protein
MLNSLERFSECSRLESGVPCEELNLVSQSSF